MVWLVKLGGEEENINIRIVERVGVYSDELKRCNVGQLKESRMLCDDECPAGNVAGISGYAGREVVKAT